MGVGVETLWGVMVSWDSAVGAGIPATGVTGRVTCGKGSNSDVGRGEGMPEPAQAANDIAISSKARSLGTLVPENPA